jgi:hypothetical protein
VSQNQYPPLGVWALYGATVRQFLQTFLPLMGFAIIPSCLSFWLTSYLPSNLLGLTFGNGLDPVKFLGIIALSLLTFTMAEIMISRYLIDRSGIGASAASQTKPTSIPALFYLAAYRLPIIVVATLLITTAYAFGLIALIIGSLWVTAAMCLLGPILGNETGQGLGIRRSLALTQQYRVQLILAILVSSLVIIAIEAAQTFLFAGALSPPSLSIERPVLLAVRIFINAAELAFMSAFFTNTYIRLRNIHEGWDTVSVFD